MKYEKLSKIFYKDGEQFFEKEIERRKNCYGSYLTSLSIQGFRKGRLLNETYNLFYVNTHKLMVLNNQVLLNSSKITTLVSKLPPYVIEPYFQKLIVNEAQSNNEIEGIRSTKKQLKEVLNDLSKPDSKHKRFRGLMKTYFFISKIKPFKDITDFRKLYDQLVSDEINQEDEPDGELFRKGYVEVNDGTSTTHIGLESETKIIEALHSLIRFLDNENHLELYRYMVAHYYYEYIHPFYDGNGRTGRLLVCSYLSRYLDRYSAITFSYAVNKNKSKYYKALEEIPSPLNKGETTFYLIDMLELLKTGQEGIIEDLELNLAKLERIQTYFQSEKWTEKGEARYLLQLMTSLHAFVDDDTSMSVTELMEMSKSTRYKINKIMQDLEEQGYVELVNQRPKTYKIREEFLESVLL
ncbi:Fic protein family with putative regulatory function [Alkalihalophilus pseudofirmus OF4]|uniref:Fic protein family with putative regulatory function n=1 Tax=Alkalihalophilus pseudofirmus (strain ATCC BAA-2126 / JCM 17055 / OF4) TaxID=398511 RepID=D3FZS7_ALKPO|nr:Fic family protein [Alkalihalophilus pseudofirmus]ADC49319.1 Fic protein family with putative regulatory function [Alkalihalophilus pseudofirmus OF4]